MKTRIAQIAALLLLVVIVMASCRSSRDGCPSNHYSGPRFKATKFKWE